MTTDQIVYLVFGVVVVTALILDLGFLSKKNTTITIRQALQQTFIFISDCVFNYRFNLVFHLFKSSKKSTKEF